MAVHVEALQSPWLVELLALYFNLKLNKARVAFPEICPGCVCDLQSVKPMLSCILHESLRLDVDATCSICLVSDFFSFVNCNCFELENS